MTRLRKQLSLLALVSTMCLTTSNAWSAVPDLAADVWTITGSDTGGNIWTGSTITFESQSAVNADFQVAGYFYWTGNAGQFGRENFSGTLFANNHLTVLGFQLVPPTSGGLVTNVTYNADVTPDGTHMINGTWGGSGIPSNAWTAVQAVPEPSVYVLLLAGLAIVGIQAHRRKQA